MTNNRPIYSKDKEGKMVLMRPSERLREKDLQKDIAKHPELISEDGEKLLLVSREQGVRDAENGPIRWAIDHLFVSPDAIPVLVEAKLASNSEVRRKVVGQLLEYAAHAAFWSPEELENSFRTTCERYNKNYSTLLKEFADEKNYENFWRNVVDNVAIGKMHLMIVSDEIPPETQKVVEYLNGQTRAKVRAVEISHFEHGDDHIVLAPRLIGETQQSKDVKRRIDVENWKDEHFKKWAAAATKDGVDEHFRAGAEEHLRIMEKLNLKLRVLKESSLVAYNQIDNAEHNVLTLYDIEGERAGPKIEFKFGDVKDRFNAMKVPLEPDPSMRKELVERLRGVVGELIQDNPEGKPSFSLKILTDAVKANNNELLNNYEQFVRDYVSNYIVPASAEPRS